MAMIIEGTKMTMTRGDTESITVSIREDGEPRPLVPGDAVYMTVRQRATDPTVVLYKQVTAFVDGVALIEIGHEDTMQLKFGTYIYDIQVTFGDGTVTTVIKPAPFVIDLEATYE